MSMGTITNLINGTYQDPDSATGTSLEVPVKSVIIAENFAGMEADAVRQLDLDFPLAIVSDPITHQVLGARVEHALESLGPIIKIHLGNRPHADMQTAELLIEQTSKAGALVAVGSGTINDLCKLAAARQNKSCAVFATAPSMNGYTSVNAAITDKGLKKSLTAVCPTGVFMDLKVLAESPTRMIRSGLGDSVCRPMAQADWLLAHLLFDSTYTDTPFRILADEEEGLFGEPEALISGDLEAMGRLARTLVLSGMGMSICGGSYPASQGEHLISHYIEMMHPTEWEAYFHGEQIAVATLIMARLQDQVLYGAPPLVRPSLTTKTDIIAHYGKSVGEACWNEFKLKKIDEAMAEKLNERITESWSEICEKIKSITVPSQTIANILTRAGVPSCYSDIDLSKAFFLGGVSHAHQIRNRYTFLDFANDTNSFEANSLL